MAGHCGFVPAIPKRGAHCAIGGSAKINTVNTGPGYWESGLETINECGKVDKTKVLVRIALLAKCKIDALMEEYKHLEWFAYLLGTKSEKEFIVEDIWIPKHQASGALVDEIESDARIKIIGAMHSHHNMGHNFSGHDHEYVNMNHDLSIVVSTTGIKAQIRKTTPCGCKFISEGDVKLYYHIDGFDKKEFIKSVKENIKTKTYSAVTYSPGSQWQNKYAGPYASGYAKTPSPGPSTVVNLQEKIDIEGWEEEYLEQCEQLGVDTSRLREMLELTAATECVPEKDDNMTDAVKKALEDDENDDD